MNEMSLPDVIEIVPSPPPDRALITVPGSKSITNRALVLAALAQGETTLRGALWSEDTQVMVDCLQDLGFMINVRPDPLEFCNRMITVYGQGGHVPRGGTRDQPLDLFVANAGTAARFLAALVCVGEGVYRLHGVPRMHERPQASLFQALRELGYRVDSNHDRLPALVHGGGPRPGACRVSISESSQFASAVLLCARTAGWTVQVFGENAEESPYVAMTTKLIEAFPHQGGDFQVEPDASSGSYFWGAGYLMNGGAAPDVGNHSNAPEPGFKAGGVSVAHWPQSGWQIDEAFPRFLPPPSRISRQDDLGDSIMTSIVLSPWSQGAVSFVELGRLRLQECERVQALRIELSKCGAEIEEQGDTLVVSPSSGRLHGAEIETYNDHRMAMCFAVVGLKVPGIRIHNPACVKKTFPNFFQKLADPTPAGLGAVILHGTTRQLLKHDDLFAD